MSTKKKGMMMIRLIRETTEFIGVEVICLAMSVLIVLSCVSCGDMPETPFRPGERVRIKVDGRKGVVSDSIGYSVYVRLANGEYAEEPYSKILFNHNEIEHDSELEAK